MGVLFCPPASLLETQLNMNNYIEHIPFNVSMYKELPYVNYESLPVSLGGTFSAFSAHWIGFCHALETEGLIISEKQLGSLGCGLII